MRLPALSLVVLVGTAGSGKSTFAARHFRPTQIVSSDALRAAVADDERDQSATAAAFEILHLIVRHRLAAGRLTVVDATNVERSARAPLLALAAEHDVPAVAVVLELPEELAVGRATGRGRRVGADVVRRQHAELLASLPGLAAEGFAAVHVLRGPEVVAGASVVVEPEPFDRRAEHGPFDIVGDVHACRHELEKLLGRLGYQIARDDEGRACGAHHPGGRRAVFVGDLVDRGPDPAGTLRLVMGMVASGDALVVAGNHEFKLVRVLRERRGGAAPPIAVQLDRPVRPGRNLRRTLELLAAEPPSFQDAAFAFCAGLPAHLVLDDGRLVVAHAGLKEEYQGRDSPRVRQFALFGAVTGERDEYGLPVRLAWAREYHGRALVVYGHTPMAEPGWVNNTVCLDTGCCFGGALTALRYPERELVSVRARRQYAVPARPLRRAG
ncbi:MAG: AAA family ATPase [Frankia sp.]|nr:AAA family ATPase [Frankia sp.]